MVAGVFEIVLGGFCLLLATMKGGLLAAQGHLQPQPFQGPSFPALLLSVVIYLSGGDRVCLRGDRAAAAPAVGVGLDRRLVLAMACAGGRFRRLFLSDGARDLGRRCGAKQIAACGGHVHTDRGGTVVVACLYVGVPGLLLAPVSPQVGPLATWVSGAILRSAGPTAVPSPCWAMLSLVFALSFFSMFSMAAYRWTFPLFGSYAFPGRRGRPSRC